MHITSILAPLIITSQHDFRKTEHYFGIFKNSFSDDYTITKFDYIDEFSIYNGEKRQVEFIHQRIGVITLRHRDVVNT